MGLAAQSAGRFLTLISSLGKICCQNGSYPPGQFCRPDRGHFRVLAGPKSLHRERILTPVKQIRSLDKAIVTLTHAIKQTYAMAKVGDNEL